MNTIPMLPIVKKKKKMKKEEHSPFVGALLLVKTSLSLPRLSLGFVLPSFLLLHQLTLSPPYLSKLF